MLPAAGVTYRAFVDPSGGSEDAMTLAIAHKTTSPDERVIVDAVREVRPPFSPSAVVDDFAVLLKSYRVSKVVGDHYGGEFVKEPFRRHGISYEVCNQSREIPCVTEQRIFESVTGNFRQRTGNFLCPSSDCRTKC